MNTDSEKSTEELLEYYKDALEREKKRNTELIADLADAESKNEELTAALKRI